MIAVNKILACTFLIFYPSKRTSRTEILGENSMTSVIRQITISHYVRQCFPPILCCCPHSHCAELLEMEFSVIRSERSVISRVSFISMNYLFSQILWSWLFWAWKSNTGLPEISLTMTKQAVTVTFLHIQPFIPNPLRVSSFRNSSVPYSASTETTSQPTFSDTFPIFDRAMNVTVFLIRNVHLSIGKMLLRWTKLTYK